MRNPIKISDSVYVFRSDLWMINSGLILNDLGSIVIDPAYFPEELQDIVRFVKGKSCKVGYVIFTHSDFDHIVGYQIFKGARTMAAEAMQDCDKKQQVWLLSETDRENNVRREEFFFPPLDMQIKHDWQMPIKHGNLHFFDAPGHTADSIFTVYEEKGILFSGDTLSDIEFPFIYYNSGIYRETLDLARSLTDRFDLQWLVPGHGNVALDRTEILQRIENDIDYLDRLRLKTQELYQQGLWEREIISVMMDFRYGQLQIEGSMVKMHLDNVKQVLKELKGNL